MSDPSNIPVSLARVREAFNGPSNDHEENDLPPTARAAVLVDGATPPLQGSPVDLDRRGPAALFAASTSPYALHTPTTEEPNSYTPVASTTEAGGASGARNYFHVSPPSPRSNNTSGDGGPVGPAAGPLFHPSTVTHHHISESSSSEAAAEEATGADHRRVKAAAQQAPPLALPSPPTHEGQDPQDDAQHQHQQRHHHSDESSSDVSPPRSPARRLTAEEEQLARLRAYNEMAGENTRGFFTDTVESLLPNSMARWLVHSGDTVTVVADEPNAAHSSSGVMHVASMAANTIGAGAQHIGDAIENVPGLMVSVIPSALMSDDVKQLLFTDFSNTFRGFFHTNILSMPFIFRQAGLVGGIFLLSFVAITSEYATEAFFGAKNQLKNAHKVVLFGDVPRMTWGQWYPMLNIFYGITHLIGFIAFSASNSVVLLGAMGMKGGGARALGLIIPSLIALPLVLMKNAHSQEPLSMLSNLLVITAVVLMFVDFPYTPTPPIKLWPSSATEFFVAMGVSVYAFTGIGSAIPIERVMPPRRYRKLLRASVAIAWALLMAFGMSGFLSYGNHTCSVMTVSLQPGPLRTAVSALLFFASIMIIPLQTFPLCELSDRRLLGLTRLTTYWDLKPNIMRIMYLIVSAFAAFIIPYYGLLLSISGALGCGIIGLVVPAALDYVRRERKALHHGRNMRFWEYLIVFGLGSYGCVVVVIGVVSGSYQLWISIQSQSTDTC